MPDWNEQIRKQLADLKLPPAREAEIVEELAQHAEDRYRELLSGGATEAEARRVALDEIGGHELLVSCVRSPVTLHRVIWLAEASRLVRGGVVR
jgi:hypothetical protein